MTQNEALSLVPLENEEQVVSKVVRACLHGGTTGRGPRPVSGGDDGAKGRMGGCGPSTSVISHHVAPPS